MAIANVDAPAVIRIINPPSALSLRHSTRGDRFQELEVKSISTNAARISTSTSY
jgi:hypothetical protein